MSSSESESGSSSSEGEEAPAEPTPAEVKEDDDGPPPWYDSEESKVKATMGGAEWETLSPEEQAEARAARKKERAVEKARQLVRAKLAAMTPQGRLGYACRYAREEGMAKVMEDALLDGAKVDLEPVEILQNTFSDRAALHCTATARMLISC